MKTECMGNPELQPCPFCGGEPKHYGDHSILCDCGAAVTHYNFDHNESHIVVDKWNGRSVNLEPIILKVSKLKDQGSAYTDLCSANYKLQRAVK